jgi:hypothetical protein
VSITLRRHLAAASLPAMVVISLSQLMSASALYDGKDLSSDITLDVLGMAVPVDPNLSIPTKRRPVQTASHETASLESSDDESDFTDAVSAPLMPGDGRSPASKDAVYGGFASDSIGSSSYIYAAHDAGDLAPKVVPANLVASFPPFDVQSTSPGKFVDDFDSFGNSNEPVTTGGDWEALGRTSIVPPSEFGSPSEDLLTGNFGNAGSSNGGNGYLDTLGDTGGIGGKGGAGNSADPLDLTAGTKGQKDRRLGAIASAAEPEGAGVAVVSLILIFVALHRRSSRRAGAARPS